MIPQSLRTFCPMISPEPIMRVQFLTKCTNCFSPEYGSVRPTVHPSVRPFVRPSVYPIVHPSVCLAVRPSVRSSVRLSGRLIVRPPSVHPSIREARHQIIRGEWEGQSPPKNEITYHKSSKIIWKHKRMMCKHSKSCNIM